MQMAHIFGLPAALLILAFVANRLSKLTRIPDIIVLLLIGIPELDVSQVAEGRD